MAAEFVDAEKLLEAVDAARPAGRNCEHDPEFTDLETKSQGRPESRMGAGFQAATPPDWPKVLEIATALFEQTKDIRVAQYLCRALLGMHGLPGLAEGLEVVHGLLERYWPTLHPQMDPDDKRPALLRVNIINGFADQELMLRPIRDAILVDKRGIGSFTLRQVIAASAANPPAGAPDPAEIERVFQATGQEGVQHTADTVKRARDTVARIETFLSKQIDGSYTVSLGPLAGVLREASAVLAARLPAPEGAADDPAPEGEAPGQPGAGPGAAPAVRVAGSGVIASSKDVVHTIDKLCEYYAKAEPSSPVPIILKRARRLVGLNFMELLCDLTPEGVGQFETISGVRRDD